MAQFQSKSNDKTALVLGALAGGAAGYFFGPMILNHLLAQVAEPSIPLHSPPDEVTHAMVQYNVEELIRHDRIQMGSYGTALAGAVLGGYIAKSLG